MIVNDEEFEADELIVQVQQQITVLNTAPQSLKDGTGTVTGDQLYIIPQDADGVSSPILGIGTEELEQPAGTTWSDVTFTLNSSTGPGQFSLYTNDAGTFTFNISEALGTDTFTFAPGGHEEQNWAFTEPGTYVLNFTASATRTVGGTPEIFTSTQDFTFSTVPEPSSALLAGLSALGFLVRRRK